MATQDWTDGPVARSSRRLPPNARAARRITIGAKAARPFRAIAAIVVASQIDVSRREARSRAGGRSK